MIKVSRRPLPSLSMGDIIRDVEMIVDVIEQGDEILIRKHVFPLVVVLTQDCDLTQEFDMRGRAKEQGDHDKTLLSVLVSPLYNAEHVYQGSHLQKLDLRMAPINRKRTPGNNLRINVNPRYHYLDFGSDEPIPPSVIDFKHYFSVSVERLELAKKARFVRQISDLYREDVAQRFATYLCRIALP